SNDLGVSRVAREAGMLLIPLLVTAAALALFLALTAPEELRRFRVSKIVLSLPLVWFVAVQFVAQLSHIGSIAAVFAITVLGFLWASNLAHFASRSFVSFLMGRGG